MCRPCGARLPSLPHLNTTQEAALSPSFCRVVPRRTILMNDASQEKRPPMRETVRDIDRQILSLLLQRHNVLVRMMRGSNRLTPQDERFLRESWEGQASKISSDPLLTSRLFNLLQEVDFLPPPSEENQTRRTAFNLAPQQKPVNIDMEGPRDQHATQVWIAIAAMTGKPLQIGKALVNDAVSDCVHMFNLMGANLHRDGNVIRHGTDCTPAGTPDKVLHVGKNPFNFYLGLAHYIGRPGHTRFSGGTELRLANFTPLRHFLPELGSRIIPLVPKTEGLPLRVECSGLLPDTIVLPADLPAEFVEALIIAAPFYGRQIVIDLGALDAGARSSMLSFLLPILSMAGCEIREEGSVSSFKVNNVPACGLSNHSENPGNEDSYEKITFDVVVIEGRNDYKSDYCKGELRGCNVSHGYQSGSIANDYSRSFKADDSDEETDSGGDTEFQVCRYVVNQLFSEVAEGKKDEKYTFNENGGKGNSPRVGYSLLGHRYADGIGEIRIEAHSGSQSHRVVGEKGHKQSGDYRRNGGCCEHGAAVHARSGQYARVDRENVDHRKKCGRTGDDLGFYIRTVLFQFKKLFHNDCSPLYVKR